MDTVLTVNDVAKILQVKPITVREMFREKRLRAFKVGKAWRTTEKMLEEDIDALARGKGVPALASAPTERAPRKAHKARPSASKPAREADAAPPDGEADDSEQLLF